MKVTSNPIVWIRVIHETDDDRRLNKELKNYMWEENIFPETSGGGGPGGWSYGYSPADADKILQWLKERGVSSNE